ncbi:uncharacterized protein RJT21DRAFT_111130 [Scheffersomyces amazonensis]|uniref:uncharacterized protein n=1 Tax=Scheffersomyces amazonensis TaxID=1078765 RepID=UPI00315D1EB3
MGLKCTNYFDNSKYESPDLKIITCKGCSSHLCLSSLIISDNFSGSSGPAYLVGNLINIEYDQNPQEKEMRTGFYLVDDIRCHQCKLNLGWYYKKSFTYRETYKEGKFVIEKSFIKFIDNNTSNNLLLEKALQNKYKRRFSSTSNASTISSDELDFSSANTTNSSLISTSEVATINSYSVPPSHPIITLHDPSSKSYLMNSSLSSKPQLMYDTSSNPSKHNLMLNSDSSSSGKRQSLDIRNFTSGLFLNGLRIPVSSPAAAAAAAAAAASASNSNSNSRPSTNHPTLASIAVAAAQANEGPSNNTSTNNHRALSILFQENPRSNREGNDDDNDVFVDA